MALRQAEAAADVAWGTCLDLWDDDTDSGWAASAAYVDANRAVDAARRGVPMAA
jgi:hypothetical protein